MSWVGEVKRMNIIQFFFFSFSRDFSISVRTGRCLFDTLWGGFSQFRLNCCGSPPLPRGGALSLGT